MLSRVRWLDPTKLARRASYFVFLLSTTSRVFPYLLIVSCASLVVAIGMSAYFFGLFSEAALRAEGIDNTFGGGLSDTFWWSLKHILDPGALSENYGAPVSVVLFALFNSIMGLLITGALIGFIVSAIQSAMERARAGIATIRETGHYLILGWNRKGPAILALLAQNRVKERIVILTDGSLDEVRVDLRQHAQKLAGLRILPVSGSTGVSSELSRVAAQNASHVVLLAESMAGKQSDLTTIKALTLLSAHGNIKQQRKRNLVAEIVNKDNAAVAQVSAKHRHPIVASSDFISKSMAHCARYPGYSQVYFELFASGKFVIDVYNLKGKEGSLFGNVAASLKNGIALGICWDESRNGEIKRKSVLNPEPGYDLTDEDALIVLRHRKEEVSFLSEDADLTWGAANEVTLERPNLAKVLVLSISPNLRLIINELLAHAASDLKVVVACRDAAYEEKVFWQSFSSSETERLSISFEEFNLSESSRLQGFQPQTFDVIFIPADESEEYIDADSRSILLLLLLSELRDKAPNERFPAVVAELLSSESRELCVETPLTDAVVSTEVVSAQLAQLVQNPFLETLYKELLNAGGIEIGIRDARQYGELNQPTNYATVYQRALEFNEIVLGFRSATGQVSINPSKTSVLQFEEGAAVIVLAQQVYV